jgi:hypothetical protein
MPTPTYTPVATISVTNSNTQTISFTNLPTIYKHLLVVVSANTFDSFSGPTTPGRLILNGLTGQNYRFTRLHVAGGSSALSDNEFGFFPVGTYATNTRNFATYEFFDYRATDKLKTGMVRFYSYEQGYTITGLSLNTTDALSTITISAAGGGGGYFTNGQAFATLFGIVG